MWLNPFSVTICILSILQNLCKLGRKAPTPASLFVVAAPSRVLRDASRLLSAAASGTEGRTRALHDQPRLAPAMRIKAVALAHLGRLDEARAELSRMLAIDPKLTIADFLRRYAHFLAPEVLELFVTGLRLAGLPEG
jgi:hypothetical protein